MHGTPSSSALRRRRATRSASTDGISTRHCPPSENRCGELGRSCRSLAGSPRSFQEPPRPLHPAAFHPAPPIHSASLVSRILRSVRPERRAIARRRSQLCRTRSAGRWSGGSSRHATPKPRLTAVLRGDAMDAPASIQTPTQHRLVRTGFIGPIRASRGDRRRGAYAIPPDRTLSGNATHRPGGGR